MGCPYANRDYRTVNPEYGTLEDFLHLVDAIHDNGMKCIIDGGIQPHVPGLHLVACTRSISTHKPDGSRGNKVGDWTDVVDLNYDVPELWDYQIESLCYWAQYVDGFPLRRSQHLSRWPSGRRPAGRWSGASRGYLAGRERSSGPHSGLPPPGVLCRHG